MVEQQDMKALRSTSMVVDGGAADCTENLSKLQRIGNTYPYVCICYIYNLHMRGPMRKRIGCENSRHRLLVSETHPERG